MRNHASAWLIFLGSLCTLASAQTKAPALDRPRQIEADWTLQEEDRRPISTREDALGAVDGVKNGSWAFHTGADNPPWWQVDLGRSYPLAKALIFNRCDGTASRNTRLIVLLSDDAKTWRKVYQHNGETFLGATDGKPLAVTLTGQQARFLRLTLPEANFLHLDEVEVYGAEDPAKNLALWKDADQSSTSQWSTKHVRPGSEPQAHYMVEQVLERGLKLAADLKTQGVDTSAAEQELAEVAKALSVKAPAPDRADLWRRARWAVRRLAMANPLLDFDRLLFVKRVPPSFSHMSDQNYGWWSRPGGGIFILDGLKTDHPQERCLTAQFQPGSFEGPDLSFDARKLIFAYCKFYAESAGIRDKQTKTNLPEDAFYHVFEMNVDGTGLRQLTHGRYDDFDARYLPGGEIVFLSTRRGACVQTTAAATAATLTATLPDSYVRCGGDPYRPVAVYTLHVMDADGAGLRAISPFENFEWTPSIAADGRILYARWDYVDRNNMPFMGLWSVSPDGTNPRAVYGNFTRNPFSTFEARCIPNSTKLVFTASAHHAITGGSLVLLDPDRGFDDAEPITRLTPEVPFPESEAWPMTFFANPWPLSERYFLTAWSYLPILSQGTSNLPNGCGLYLYDAFGNLELLWRDPEIGCMFPLPLKPRSAAPRLASALPGPVTYGVTPGSQALVERRGPDSHAAASQQHSYAAPPERHPDAARPQGADEGCFLLTDVYQGLPGVARGAVKRLRIVGVPPKTQPVMNSPNLGVTSDDPGKFVVGTVPVAADGSAYFRAPAGTCLFFQALDDRGYALQTMRTVTSLQPGQTLSCVGCHEPRNTTPHNRRPGAAGGSASRVAVGPEGSWPLRYDRLVQPVLDRRCVSCHQAGGEKSAAGFDLTADKSYANLLAYGKPSLADQVRGLYGSGRSVVGDCGAARSPVLALLTQGKGHYGVALDPDDLTRLATWMDVYGQRTGSFSPEQEQDLRNLRAGLADMLLQ